jgi:hypothetical protein
MDSIALNFDYMLNETTNFTFQQFQDNLTFPELVIMYNS